VIAPDLLSPLPARFTQVSDQLNMQRLTPELYPAIEPFELFLAVHTAPVFQQGARPGLHAVLSE